jgi:hypothetical protein
MYTKNTHGVYLDQSISHGLTDSLIATLLISTLLAGTLESLEALEALAAELLLA